MITDTVYQQFERLLNRSERVRTTALVLANSAGCLLMLSPALSLVAAAGSAVYIYNHIQGPLDWFIFECHAGSRSIQCIPDLEPAEYPPGTP